jgi:hypothetical protein
MNLPRLTTKDWSCEGNGDGSMTNISASATSARVVNPPSTVSFQHNRLHELLGAAASPSPREILDGNVRAPAFLASSARQHRSK